MKIQTIKTGNVFTLKVAFVTVSIDFDNIPESIETIKHFAKLLIPKDTIDMDSLDEINKYSDIIMNYIECFQGFDSKQTIRICSKTNKIYLEDIETTGGSIDIIGLLNVFKQVESVLN